MQYLVTGAAGFLGRNTVAALCADGHHVIGVDNFITSQREDFLATADGLAAADEQSLTFYQADVATPEFRELAASLSFDGIFHLACPTGVPNLSPLALEMLETCYEGSRNVLEVARAQGVPAVLASSAEVYGDPEVSPQTESYTGNVDQLGPRKAYEEGKRVAETWFGIYAERYGVAAKIGRVFNSYGPGMSLHDTRVIPAMVRAGLRGDPLTVYGDGEQNRCHTFVADTVRGLRLVLERGLPARAYNLGSPNQVTVRELAELIAALTDSGSPIRNLPRPKHDCDARLPDTQRARDELQWQPTVSLQEGLQATIADIRDRLAAQQPGSTLAPALVAASR